MASPRRLYFFGGALLLVAVYQAYRGDFVEMTLYVLAGLTFGINGLVVEPALARHKKTLVVLSWIFISASVIDFFYLIQFKP